MADGADVRQKSLDFLLRQVEIHWENAGTHFRVACSSSCFSTILACFAKVVSQDDTVESNF